MKEVGIGIIGGGLMGREIASAFSRWCALTDIEVSPKLVAVADLNEAVLSWFDRIDSVEQKVTDYHELLANPKVEVVYVAVPHHLHAPIYEDVLKAGKDLLAEKPFGIDLEAARHIEKIGNDEGRFVRCSSEFPFLPGPQAVVEYVRSGKVGRILEVVSGFHHASDMDPSKAANWKRQSKSCGEIGVMGDLGMHACHVPLRLGWSPKTLMAQLIKGYAERPDGKGGMTSCDTWDNALLHTWVEDGASSFPMRLEMKRLAPGETNTWFIEVLGTDGGMRFSTKQPKTLWTYVRQEGKQHWVQEDLGFGMPFGTVTGGIFEPGFPDTIQQMWAAFLAEREGQLEGRFHCVTPQEAVRSHELFAGALSSQAEGSVISV